MYVLSTFVGDCWGREYDYGRELKTFYLINEYLECEHSSGAVDVLLAVVRMCRNHTHMHTRTHTHILPYQVGLCLQTGKTLNECPAYDTKASDGEALASELWGMWSTPSLPSLPGPLWPGVVAPDRVLSMSQKELFDI